MNLNIDEFIKHLEEEFEDDIQPGTLKPETIFEKSIALTSVNALILISMIKVEYDVEVNANDLTKCKTVKDLFDVIESKIN